MGKHDAPKNRADIHAELKNKSLEQPGIKEMITVYNLWEKSHQIEQDHRSVMDSNHTVTNSDSSHPKFV